MFIFYALFERHRSRYVRAVVSIRKLLKPNPRTNFMKRAQREDCI